MALPTIKPSWVKIFKTPGEISVKRVEKHSDIHSRCLQNHQYFQNSEVRASINKGWTSEDSFKKSMNSVEKLFQKVDKKDKQEELEKRRMNLQSMLFKENTDYQEELKSKRLGGNLSLMQSRVEHLQMEKEEERKQVAEEKKYELWRRNEPRLRNLESEKHRKLVTNSWKDQISEKNEAKECIEAFDKSYEEKAERKRLEDLERDHEIEQIAQEKQRLIAGELRDQMEELKKKEKESEMLRAEEILLNENDKLLREAENTRLALESQRRKRMHGRVLIRQYKEQLKQKTQEVQEALRLDLNILKEIAEKEAEEKVVESSRKEQLRSEAFSMQQVLLKQLELEKRRESELDALYNEEAQREWQKREWEWQREKSARERLVKSVLEERQEQIREKLKNVHVQKQTCIEEREALIRKIEDHQEIMTRKKTEANEKKMKRQVEIREQIAARESLQEQEKRHSEATLSQLRRNYEQEEALYKKEAQKVMSEHPLVNPSFRRKKVAFT